MKLNAINMQYLLSKHWVYYYYMCDNVVGVSIVIPKGAIPEGLQQEIYFKVCQDNSILPPLDKDKGRCPVFRQRSVVKVVE